MNEHAHDHEPKPARPELTLGQRELHDFCDTVLAPTRGERRLSFVDFRLPGDPAATESLLRANGFGALFVPNGESFAMESAEDYYEDLHFHAGDVPASGMSIRAWEWFEDKRRIDPAGPTTPPYDIIEYPGEQDWINELDINFYYIKGDQTVIQTLSAYGSSYKAATPSIYRTLYATAYMETGYEHHGYTALDTADDADVSKFVELLKTTMIDSSQRAPSHNS